MKIAYIILAYKYPEQLARLVRQLNSDDVSFFIHIDKKTSRAIYQQVVAQFKDFENVFFIKRHRSMWGSFECVKATLEGIKAVVETEVDFDYVIHLSGQDYSIKSREQIKRFLEENKGKEFLEYFPLPCSKWKGGGLRRLEYWHFRWNKIHLYFPPEKREFKSRIGTILYSLLILPLPTRPKFSEEFPLYGGSFHWCLTGKCIKWIDTFVKQNPNFVNRFKYTYVPDEEFYQTLLMSSPFRDNIISDDLKYKDWGNDVNAINTKILEKTDFQKLKESKSLFARKFDATVDSEVLDMIDALIESDSSRVD